MTLIKKIASILLLGAFLSCLTALNATASSFRIANPKDTSYDVFDNLAGPPNTTACPNFGQDVGYGQLTLGIRAGACILFDPGSIGFGLGVALRYRLAKHWSLEGYADIFHTNIQRLGYRKTERYGCNALYYWGGRPMKRHKGTPFLLGGISYENIVIYSYTFNTAQYGNSSPWLDLGFGNHYYLTSRWDITLEFFYVLPLATHPASYIKTFENGPQSLRARYQDAFNIGGIFGIISINYTFGNI